MIKPEIKAILNIIDRDDIRKEIEKNFNLKEQEDLFAMLKDIMGDEFMFVINIKKNKRGF